MQQEDGRSRPETAQKNTRFLRLDVNRRKILERREARHDAASA